MADLANTVAHTETAHHDAGSKAGMPQLDPASFASQLFWLTVTFFVLYMLMARSVIPRIRSVLEKRQGQIDHDLSTAEKAKEEASQAKEHYEKELSTARAKANTLIQDAQLHINNMAVKENHKLDQKLAKSLEGAEATISEQIQKAKADVKPVMSDLAAQIVEALIRVKPAPQKADDAVDAAMKG